MAGTGLTAGPALLAVRRAVLDSLAGIPAEELVLVACSGGADSLALAAGASLCRRPVGAVVVDHGLQEGSAAVAERAADACRGLGLAPVLVERVAVGAAGGPEAAARTARYAGLRRAAAETGAVALLLAHSLDDQAETVLLRLARGSGARSLAGMAPREGDLLRPLLGLRRQVLRQACEQAGLTPYEDPHNQDPAYARSRLRAHGLPALVADLGDAVVPALARTAESLRADNQALDLWADREFAACQTGPDGVRWRVSTDLPPAVLLRLLRRMALAAGVPGAALGSTHLHAAAALVQDWRGQGPVDLPGRVRAGRVSGTLVFVHGAADGSDL